MRTRNQLSHRWLLLWPLTLVVTGAPGIVPQQLVHQEVIAQQRLAARPVTGPGRDNSGASFSASRTLGGRLKTAEAHLKVAQAERKVAECLVEQSEARAMEAAAIREFHGHYLDHMSQLEKRGTMPHEPVEDEQIQLRVAQAAEREAKAKIASSRASLAAAAVAVREAETLRDIAGIESRIAPDPGRPHIPLQPHTSRVGAEGDLREAQARLRVTRLDRARYEVKVAGAEIDQEERGLERANVALEYRTKVYERIKRLRRANAIAQDAVDKEEQSLAEARKARRDVEMAVGLAHARLKAAEAHLKGVEGGAISPGRTSQ